MTQYEDIRDALQQKLERLQQMIGKIEHNSIEVSPRLCRGDSQRLTYAGRCDFPVVPPKAQRKGSQE